MYYTAVLIDDDVLVAIRDLPKRIAPELDNELRTEVVPFVERRVQSDIATYPGAVSRPFAFATARSRRAYFATRGFGKGIPYRRTGALGKGWKVKLDRRRNEGFLSVANDVPYAGYVYGSGLFSLGSFRQVPGHKNTGWGNGLDEKIFKLSEDATAMLIAAFVRAADRLSARRGG